MKGILKVCNEKYIVNEEKGIVTYLINVSTNNCGRIQGDDVYYNEYGIAKKLGFYGYYTTVIGIAKCNPTDKFDLNKGIQIARNRAEIKVAQLEQKAIRILCKHIGRIWDYTSALYNNRSEMIKEKKEYIKNI